MNPILTIAVLFIVALTSCIPTWWTESNTVEGVELVLETEGPGIFDPGGSFSIEVKNNSPRDLHSCALGLDKEKGRSIKLFEAYYGFYPGN